MADLNRQRNCDARRTPRLDGLSAIPPISRDDAGRVRSLPRRDALFLAASQAWIGSCIVIMLTGQVGSLICDRTSARVTVEQHRQLLRLNGVHAEDHAWPGTWLF